MKSARFYTGGRNNGRKDYVSRKRSVFKKKCFNCDKFGHMKRGCPDMKGREKDDEDAVFAAGEIRSSGWLFDSGTTAHMTPH